MLLPRDVECASRAGAPRAPSEYAHMNIMLTGARNVGKTTVARLTLDTLEVREGLDLDDVGGFFTEPLGDPVDPKGHVLYAIGHRSRTFAHVNSKKGLRVGRFRVAVDAFERQGVNALRDARDGSQMVIMDEIGRFEVHAPKFVSEIERCLDCAIPVLGVLSDHGGPVVESVAARDDVRVIPVEEASRDLLPAAITNALACEIGRIDVLRLPRATGVILAGGKGSRLSPDKGWLEVGGKPIVERVRDALAPVTAELLVAGHPDIAARLALPVVADEAPGAGPLAGIAASLAVAENDVLSLCAWDMPFPDTGLVAHMLALAGEGFDAVAPRAEHCAEPLFAVYTRACMEPAGQLLAAGQRRPLALLEQVNTRWIEDSELAVFGDPEVTLMSVNTPADLTRAEALLSRTPRTA